MTSSNYDVVIVGAGCAGLTAAIGLARAGFHVVVIEAAAFPGAENWSGCVYFGENLAQADILGADGVEALAWERRLVERGLFTTDGHSLLGLTYRDPLAFRHCYTVLRPIYDHHLAQVARQHGAALLCNTTVESLVRDGGRVIGVCTNRGALYADLVFLAEGDASHLVTREGYERFTDPREGPKFLHGIKQVIELPSGAVEELFGVGPEEGVAYEMLLRNGTLRGKNVLLNMGGFLYTNRHSLSLGLVLPTANLHEHFAGDPNLLMEWFEGLPVLQPWLKEGRRGPFGAKLIRGGGARDIPRLIDDGLAIGGAASAIGIDFPYPNFTGPATAMGLLLARAARRIREEKTGFTQEALRRHYLAPLQQTHYWRDVEFLRHWPSYVKRTAVFFGSNIDLALGTAYVWTRPQRWLLTRWFNWLRLLGQVAGLGHWPEIRADLRHLARALNLREVLGQPAPGRLILDGCVNALRDLFGSPRPDLPEAGAVRLHYRVADEADTILPPAPLRRWFRRFAPVLASAARRVYTNDTQPLPDKLLASVRLLLRQMNVLDLVAVGLMAVAAGVSGVLLKSWGRLRQMLRRPPKPGRGLYPRYARAARQAGDLTRVTAAAAQNWEGRLGQLAYETVKESHIHVLWPQSLPQKSRIVEEGLWHVCPAHVYEARPGPQGQLQVVVNFENCIKCETCWRTSDLVDWGRDGQHRFIYPVHSPVVTRLIDAVHTAGLARPALPRTLDSWEAAARRLAERLQAVRPGGRNGEGAGDIAEVYLLLTRLERKLEEFDQALAEEPRTVDRGRGEYLEMLARYAQQLAVRVVEVLRNSPLADNPQPGIREAHRQLLELAQTLALRAEERDRRTWDQRFAWAAADGRQMRQHHITGLRCVLGVLARHVTGPATNNDPTRGWLRAEDAAAAVAETRARWAARLDAAFPPTAWRERERGEPLSTEQDAVLRDLLAQVPALDPANLSQTLHPPLRKALLAELGRRDPSLAYRAAAHLWARDLASLTPAATVLTQAAQRWAHGDEWACFASVDASLTPDGRWKGSALFVPAVQTGRLLLLVGDQLVVMASGGGSPPPLARDSRPPLAWTLEPLATLGLRGAGLARLGLEGFVLPDSRATVDRDRILRAWSVLSAADLVSIAHGMTDQLYQRAVAHATSRVQFPGLFQDDEARDTIGKLGAVKKMVAEIAARRYLIDTLEHALSPVDFSAPSVERTALLKAVVAEALGTAPGSVSYNAGQIFGGTGYSEDDILAKFYRDAAAWRYLGPGNVEVLCRHGEALVRGWRADGSRLASLRDEAVLFDQLAQRKALQAELDEVRVVRSRLRETVNRIEAHRSQEREQGAAASLSGVLRSSQPELLEDLARQDAHLLCAKALLLRTHARLEAGLSAEIETALVRVWLNGAAASLEEFEGRVQRWLQRDAQPDDRPVVEPSAGPPVRVYADYLAAPCPYDSGDFLLTPVDLLKPRYVPEMVESDPTLAVRNTELRDRLAAWFGPPRDGLPYERYIERQHRPSPEDLEFCRRNGFFRYPIPRDLGGEGRSKAEYYLLTTAMHRLADVAMSLTVQVNSSLGTTPVLLARGKDLPRAQKEVGPFVGDTALQREVCERLEAILQLFSTSDARRIEQSVRELGIRLEETVLARTALKVLAHRFVDVWQQAVRAGTAFDLAGMRARLEEALAAWKDACARADEFHAELGRRREACDLFLRWVAAGQISGFALTEPSAGSDTARIATRAVLRSVPVERESDGVLRFVPWRAGDASSPSSASRGTDVPRSPGDDSEVRYLLDASRLEFRSEGVFYRWSDTAEPSPIHFEEYDYETDDPRRQRFYDHGSRRVHFTDIAQLRQRDGRTWYDYWELTGSKMWITNGRMCGVLCLYAKTDEGVTGFIVDRHAEGLVVGKDEEKMGQCGSPTNELSLQGVRVPRENVIGLEGRGQVNALETLNVGRAGLAMSAMCQMEGLIESSRAFARSAYGTIPEWVAWRLRQMEEDRFIAEALAYEVVGRFEHPQTRSVRLESAIAKMVASELLHQVIELAEDVHGLAGQTQLHLVEKRKRDARVLNIYEGTNEVQRFLILRELAAEVAPRWARASALPAPRHLGREALELEALKGETRKRIDAAVSSFGQQLWQNPNLQANCFLLSEAVAWLKAADSTLGRLAWLSRAVPVEEEIEPDIRLDLARRALARCQAEVQERLKRFDEELAHLRRGYYAPEVRAASLVFRQATEPVSGPAPASRIARPLSILVIVEPLPAAVPHPQVLGGRLLEAHWALNHADRAALETALRLREAADAPVTIEVAAVGPRGAAPVLREALSLGADRVRLVLTETEAVTPDSAAAALAVALRSGPAFNVVLGGSVGGGEEGVLARLTAEALGVACAGSAAQLAVHFTEAESDALLVGADDRSRLRPLPVAVLIEPGLSLRPFRIEGYLAALDKPVETERWPRRVPLRGVEFAAGMGGAAPSMVEAAPHFLTVAEAADRLLAEVGRRRIGMVRQVFEGTISDVASPSFAPTAVVAVLATDAEGGLQPSAGPVLHAVQLLSDAAHPATVLVLVPSAEEEAHRRAAAAVFTTFSGNLVLLTVGDEAGPNMEIRGQLLKECWRAGNLSCQLAVGEPWTETAFAALAVTAEKLVSPAILRVRRIVSQDGRVVLETFRAAGKLVARQPLPEGAGSPCWLTLTADAEVAEPTARPRAAGRVERWSPRLERFYGRGEIQRLLEELKQETGLVRLADAEFVIDVGFGVGNRDGYETVIEPLERALRGLGVRSLTIGGSRKVTEELHLLPADRQIGQSGVSVNPRLLLAIGVSGAPQHMNYIGGRAIVLAFNRDPEAPIMTWNRRQARPRVFPVVGDLFQTVPAFTAVLQAEQPAHPELSSRIVSPAAPR